MPKFIWNGLVAVALFALAGCPRQEPEVREPEIEEYEAPEIEPVEPEEYEWPQEDEYDWPEE